MGRSGAIQEVVNLELHRPTLGHINVVPEGVNAILPNMDLVFVISSLCETEGFNTAYHVPV